MSYQVAVIAEDGTEREVEGAPTKFEIEWDAEKGLWVVCAGWLREGLSDPDDDDTLGSAWPQTSGLKVWKGREEVFEGKVTKVGYKDDIFFVEAATERSENPDEEMLIVVATDEPGSHNTLITVDNRGHGPVAVNFGDGTENGENAGDGVAVTAHTYAEEGGYTVTVTDISNTERTGQASVVIPHEDGS